MKPAVFVLFCAVLLALAGCAGPAFNRDWKQAVAEWESGSAKEPVAGPWTGAWLSGMNQHTGELRCLISPVDGSEDLYRFRYRATWKKVLSGGFKVEFPVTPDVKGGYVFAGEHDLGMFGAFEHRGRIHGDEFSATYQSSLGDHGTFEMERP